MPNLSLSYIYVVIPIILLLVMLYALFDAVRRSGQQFGLAGQSKTFWVLVLTGAALYYGLFRVGPLWMPYERLIAIILLVATFYYLGPERQAMGHPDGGRFSWRNRGGGRPSGLGSGNQPGRSGDGRPGAGSTDWRRW